MSLFTTLPTKRYSPEAFADFHPQRAYSDGNARALMWMSQLAYEVDGIDSSDEPDKINHILELWGLKLVGRPISKQIKTVLPIASTHCFVATGRGATIVAFAGTDPVVLANWITDFDTRPTAAGVAEGYLTAVKAVAAEVRQQIQAVPEAKVYFTGHSLGGTLTAVLAQQCSHEGIGTIEAVYTFGMPRPGDEAFRTEYNNALGDRTYRLVHGEDVVPSVAPSFLGFRHVGLYRHCPRSGKFAQSAFTPGSDDPQFVRGVSKELVDFLHNPSAAALAGAAQLLSVGRLAGGLGPLGARADLTGVIIELLPPRVHDHVPESYLAALS